jgi:two-component system OmpR family response regulator
MRILIIEDHLPLAQALKHHFNDKGHAVTMVHDGEAGVQFLTQEQFDLCILDINLPFLTGLEILSSSRDSAVNTPVIILTAQDSTHHRIEGLDAGADDYLAKPFEMAELDARVRAVLRRRPTHNPEQLVIGPLAIDYTHRQVIHKGQTIGLAKKEFAAFECLAESSGRIVSKSNLMNYVYGVGEDVSETTLEVLVSRLRKKLSQYGVQINMVRGLGYFLRADR